MKILEENYPKDCPINRVLSLMGGKWMPQILFELFQGTRRFGELRKALPGISPKTLTERLRTLENNGIVYRIIYPEVPPRVEYRFTPRGESLGKITQAMIEWQLGEIPVSGVAG